MPNKNNSLDSTVSAVDFMIALGARRVAPVKYFDVQVGDIFVSKVNFVGVNGARVAAGDSIKVTAIGEGWRQDKDIISVVESSNIDITWCFHRREFTDKYLAKVEHGTPPAISVGDKFISTVDFMQINHAGVGVGEEVTVISSPDECGVFYAQGELGASYYFSVTHVTAGRLVKINQTVIEEDTDTADLSGLDQSFAELDDILDSCSLPHCSQSTTQTIQTSQEDSDMITTKLHCVRTHRSDFTLGKLYPIFETRTAADGSTKYVIPRDTDTAFDRDTFVTKASGEMRSDVTFVPVQVPASQLEMHQHTDLIQMYAEDSKTMAEPFVMWRKRPIGNDKWMICTKAPRWNSNWEYKRSDKAAYPRG